MSAKRSYSDREKGEALAVLASNRGNLSATSRDTGIPASTLKDWSENKHISADVTEIRDEKKGELSAIFESLVRKGLYYLDQSVSQAKFGELSLGVCQWTDKMQLLNGKPTSRNENLDGNRAWAEEQLAGLMKEFDLSREQAIELAKKNAPTLAKWVM